MPNTFERTTTTVAAWNLAGFNPIGVDRRKKQAKGLRLLDAEVVTLVEIPSAQYLDELRDEVFDGGKGPAYIPIFEEQSTASLNIGVLVKDGVTFGTSSLMPGSDAGSAGNRKALVVEDVKIGKFDFTLIGVHLKSGRARPEQKIRDEQCKVIGDFITDLRGPNDRNPDVLLMGDFNMIPGQDTSNFHHLGGDDVMDFISSWDLQERYSHILPKGRANLLDGFAISQRHSTEYIKGSLRLFPMHWNMNIGREEFRATVSDHLPFVATFRIADID